MPTVVVLDTSLSMMRLCQPPPNGSEANGSGASEPAGHTHLDVAKHGIDVLLQHLAHHYRLEHAALITYSSVGKEETLSTFDRDMGAVRALLAGVEAKDQSHVLSGLAQAQNLVEGTWGSSSSGVPVHVILVSDGSLNESLLSERTWQHLFPMPFKGKLTVVCACHPRDPYLARSRPAWEKLLGLTGLETRLLVPEGEVSVASVEALFNQVLESDYREYVGTFNFGDELSTKVTLCPPPRPYKAERDFEAVEAQVSDAIDVKGFLSLSDVSSPPVVSRHIVLPWLGRPASDEDSRAPSLCVFLHGALKVESLCALVEVAPQWFGIVFSWADTKKKSSLMLALFEPGPRPVPWLGDLTQLGPRECLNSTNQEPFPIKVSTKPSYSASCVVWIRQAALHSDVQKILRHARKMPDKAPHFYKELNKLKRAALCIGYTELLEGMASTLEKESSLLPATANPECAVQLAHAARELRSKRVLDVAYAIEPAR